MPVIGALRNQAVTDNYDDCTLNCRGATDIQVTITGGTVLMQITPRLGGMGTSWGIEEFQGPQSFTIDSEPIDGIRFKNGQPGATAVRVNVTASQAVEQTSP